MEKFASFIEWLFKRLNPSYCLHHYLDDFIFLGEKQSVMCAQTMSDFERFRSLLGVPLAEGKTVGPTVILVFLALELDSVMS